MIQIRLVHGPKHLWLCSRITGSPPYAGATDRMAGSTPPSSAATDKNQGNAGLKRWTSPKQMDFVFPLLLTLFASSKQTESTPAALHRCAIPLANVSGQVELLFPWRGLQDRMDSSSSSSFFSSSPEAATDRVGTVMSLDFVLTSPQSGRRDVSTAVSTWTSPVGPVLTPASLHHLDRMEPGQLEELVRMLAGRMEEVFSLLGRSTTELDVELMERLLPSLLRAVETQYGVPISWMGLRSASPSEDREDQGAVSFDTLVDMAEMYFFLTSNIRDGCSCEDGLCTLWQREIADSVEVIEGLPSVSSDSG
jgi:hypothetical protein